LFSEGEASKVFSQSLAQWLIAAQAQQQALETLANVFVAPTLANASEKAVFTLALPPLARLAVEAVGQFEKQLGEPLVAALPALDGALDKLQLLQLRALHALANAVMSASSPALLAPLGSAVWPAVLEQLHEATHALRAQQQQQQQEKEEEDELVEALSGAAWALARAGLLAGAGGGRAVELLAASLRAWGARGAAGALGALAPMLAREPTLLALASSALACRCRPDTAPLLLAECCDALVDLFSDDATHAVFVAQNVAAVLAAAPALLRKAAAAPDLQEEEVERIAEVASNCQALLQYKKNN
jgi:hypothetical protein